MGLTADVHLLRLLWQKGKIPSPGLVTAGGERVEVLDAGDWNAAGGCFSDCRVRIGDTVFSGDVDVSDGSSRSGSVILRVVPGASAVVCRDDGSIVPHAVLAAEERFLKRYDALLSGRGECRCAERLAGMEPLVRVGIVTRLVSDRMERKHRELMEIHHRGEDNWNSTLYVMAFRAMAGPRNKEAYTRLAFAVPYNALSHERESPVCVEAMLLGAAGLLGGRDGDDYMCRLNGEFDHLRRKYSIIPLRPSEWQGGGVNPSGNHVLRIAQLASFFCQREFLFANVMECRTGDDIYRLFRTEASDYWSTHYVPARRTALRVKSIGYDKSQLMGINLVVPLMFAYGRCMADDALMSRALQLLEDMAAEDNAIIRAWRRGGLTPRSAFDSQGVIELNNEYCKTGACALCRVGKRVIME